MTLGATEFPRLRDPRYPVHRIADRLEPYLTRIVERYGPERIILFGSQAFGEPTADSDVDLLIVREDDEKTPHGGESIRGALFDVERPQLSFTILTRPPRHVRPAGANGFVRLLSIGAKGVEIYAAQPH